jgi:SAM-dependent methyltransferase
MSAQPVTRIELGCGNNKREGFHGLDIVRSPVTDYVANFEVDQLPFPDDSIEYVYSNHTFEHLGYLPNILREIVRVCRHDAVVEIWTPYGPSRDAFVIGHLHFLNESHWKHICFEHDRNYLGEAPGYLLWEEARYNLTPGILPQLQSLQVSIDFAIEHMFDIAFEWGVFLRVKKDLCKAPGPQKPERLFRYGRDNVVST